MDTIDEGSGASFFNKCTDTFAEIMFGEATMKAIALNNESSFKFTSVSLTDT